MKIAVISSTIFAVPPPGYSGLEMIAWLCAKGLAEKGHEVFLIAPEGSVCPGVTIISNGPPGNWDEKAAYSHYWQHLAGMDVVVDHSWCKWSHIGKAEGWLKATVLGVMHAPVNTMYQSLPPGVNKPCFVCISDDQRNHFEALFDRPARTAWNGIDVDFYKPMGIPRSSRYLFLARFSSIKGPDLAIAACKALGAELDMIGDTSITNEPELFEQCKRAADGEKIRIIGGVSRGETVWWHSQARCLLHPNMRFREPLGLSPLESMACGTPVIAWRYGAMKETIKHGETGWLVESPEEMIEVMRTATISDGMRKRCREWVADNFTVQKMVDRYEELCKEAVETGGW